MKIAVFDTHRFERDSFEAAALRLGFKVSFFENRLTAETASAARGFDVVCSFVNDRLDAAAISALSEAGVRLIALRSAGFNHVDLASAARFGIRVARVPAYSPHAIAEHAVALILALNRKICRASARVHDLNFSLEGLVGFDLHGKTIGIVGTGRIGSVLATIMKGFGCRVLASDRQPSETLREMGAQFVSLDDLLRQSDVVSLHLPLTDSTRHLIGDREFSLMKPGAMLINTGRGALIDTKALIRALKSGRIGSAGLDVYEEEENLFFEDRSDQVLQDDVLARLLSFPNVLITAHQAFLTREALDQIVEITFQNIREFERGEPLSNEVSVPTSTPPTAQGS